MALHCSLLIVPICSVQSLVQNHAGMEVHRPRLPLDADAYSQLLQSPEGTAGIAPERLPHSTASISPNRVTLGFRAALSIPRLHLCP